MYNLTLRMMHYSKLSIGLTICYATGATLKQVSVTTCNLEMTRSTGKDNQDEQDPMEQDHHLIIPPRPPMVRDHLVPLYFVISHFSEDNSV